jgi:hypothetical protein
MPLRPLLQLVRHVVFQMPHNELRHASASAVMISRYRMIKTTDEYTERKYHVAMARR